MRAIILAAGRGSRMKSLTDNRPKCLIPIQGRPLLVWQLEVLQEAGINDIAIVTGYRREALASFGLVEFYNSRWAETNMVSSLEYAGSWLRSAPCLICYSDIFYSLEAVRALVDSSASLAITYDVNWLELWTRRFADPLLDAETFRLSEEGDQIIEIGNKPYSTAEIQGQYMGLLRFTPKAWDEVLRLRSALSPAEADHIHLTSILQKIIEAGRVDIIGIPYSGKWGEVDSPDDLKVYQDAEV